MKLLERCKYCGYTWEQAYPIINGMRCGAHCSNRKGHEFKEEEIGK
jgi:hypothetical protein